jgi:hypothetical protein
MCELFGEYEIELLHELTAGGVRFVVVGGAAVELHGYRRGRNDLDLLIEQTPENMQRLIDSMPARHKATWTVHRLMQPGVRVEFDPAYGFDLLTVIKGVDTTEAINSAVAVECGSEVLPVISKPLLIQSKKAIGEEKDLADVTALEAL